jgi:glycosyltransferase involved in cell wall biosynthesis
MGIVNLFSPNWHPADSYGRIAYELAYHLETSGYHVNKFGDGAPKQEIHVCFGGIFLGYPTMHTDIISQFRLAGYGARLSITMFESTKLPDDWASALNACDKVLVPADFLVDVFQQSGVGAPIEVVPLGISKAFIEAVKRRVVFEWSEKDPLTFVCIADRGNRKNWQKVMFAFVRAFGDDMRFKLLVKSRKLPLRLTNPNIEIIAEDYSDEQMAELYANAHVLVFPSSGEGFGLPPREFAATGGIALATNWGGMADDIQQWGIPLPHTLVDAWSDKDEWYGKLGQWADVDIDILVDQMRYIADHYESYADFGIRAGGFVRSHYRWSTFANRVQTAWEGITTIKEGNYGNNGHREANLASENGRLVDLIPG